jgi:hypothetical protein
MTLHERITAAVEKRLAVAQAATPGPWVYGGDLGAVVVIHDRDSLSSVASARMADAAFVAANDPARIIRDCRRDLKVLARHRPTADIEGRGPFYNCRWCSAPVPRHCAEIRDLAEAYEIGVDDGDG